ncbi:MAG: helix-turn-helix domain-containing protein [Leptospiraceae bacterium]|nr:helix-turn-helix domain-containing protein [Leptospiraceae bacterium]
MQVELLLIPGAPASVIAGLIDFFQVANLELRQRKNHLCRITTVSPRNGPVALNGGMQIVPDRVGLFESNADLLIVPAIGPQIGRVKTSLQPEAHWIRAKAEQGIRVASVCTGAFLLASTGLLDGQSATTHWLFANRFRRMFPGIHLEIEKLVVDNGTFLTSGGSNAFYDLALHVTEQYLGREIALTCAHHLLLDTDRISQTPFMSFTAQKHHEDLEIKKAQEFLEKEFASEVSLERLASRVGLSGRSFKRRFKKATGDTPSAYLQRLRIEWARDRLARTEDSIEAITYAVGYENAGFFRALFKRYTGTTPFQYRRKHSRIRAAV